ncbi:hypothetical protein HNQ59_000459 [Chitinivorax tropicus]|uniref:Uncharacterized protein n=1 Tax=Chitinivorax tropicus TaxID=714531 RepID=A0A840MK37_9PROT|nr:hypothetical protein [Chitinivorax tropicus]MBB5017197.1 hypothetical protein [Chitinivorax tropicus]
MKWLTCLVAWFFSTRHTTAEDQEQQQALSSRHQHLIHQEWAAYRLTRF